MAVIVVVGTAAAALAAPKDPRALPGWPLYDRYCLACHGAAGDGAGPAAPFTSGRPRAFSRGEYEWRSTPIGKPPTDDDLRATIRFGAAGTSMPGFALTADEVDRLIAIVKAFDPTAFATAGAPVVLGPPRPRDLERGAFLWTQLACDRCHGEHGHGDGPSAKQLAEPPYDLVARPLARPRATDDADARRRAAATSIATGMAGSPMPGFAGQVSDADLWALADHVIDLERPSRRARDVLDADDIEADRTAKLTSGTWPGNDVDEGHRQISRPTSRSGRSLGSFVILDHVIQACLTNLPYVYLGYWVRGSEKMDYKVRFSPIELLKLEGWTLVVGGAAKAVNGTL